uniref:Uncharacterized protein MANES_01G185700 n=1 Tax=Rhizophora mucronata TaxID=61149 RepID=A0A2P2Q3E9_RHIMU
MEREDEGEETRKLACRRCGHVGLDESDGFFYCQECGAQADDIILTGVADEDFVDKGGDGGGPIYSSRFTRRSQSTAGATAGFASQTLFSQMQEEADNQNIDGGKNIKKEEHDSYYYNYMDGVGPTEPDDFGSGGAGKLSYEDYYNEVRIRYVMGMQWMIQLQCEALVEKFKARPLICGVAATVWLRFLARTRVFKDSWADDVLLDSEAQKPGEPEEQLARPKNKDEPHNKHGQRAVMLWFRELRKMIPLSCSLAISFLACHVVREAILPTDIVRWSVEGKLPYFTAHVEIEKRFEQPSPACPLSPSLMFRPSHPIPVQKLESMAASIADSIGLHLPPVNFYQIAYRYLQKLSLPIEKILPHSCRIYEWSMPPELWLSMNDLRLPTRVGVMSILIVAVRILYNINGFGEWERSLSDKTGIPSSSHDNSRLDSTSSSGMKCDTEKCSISPLHEMDDSDRKFVRNASGDRKMEFSTAELLHKLEARYHEIVDTYDFAEDLPSYLLYCKDVVFAGAGPSHMDHRVEEELIEKLWDLYENAKDPEPAEEHGMRDILFNQKRSRNDEECIKNVGEKKKTREGFHQGPSVGVGNYNEDDSQEQNPEDGCLSRDLLGDQHSEHKDKASTKTQKEKAIRRLKLDMEENRFCYIPPRVKIKRMDYLHYVRKVDEGSLTYVAHADYYILLRACARAAQVDIRIMHIGVLSLERRLAWLEKRIDHCLHLTPPTFTCEYCRDEPDHPEDDPVGLSNLNL